MKVEIFSFCDFAQENSGKLTVVGTFDTIISRDFPCIHPQLSVVIRLRFDLWEFSPHNFRIECHDLDGNTNLKPISGNLDVREGGNATAVSHLVFNITNFRLVRDGILNFILFLDDKEVMTIPLYISKG